MSNDSTCITRVKLRNYKSIAHCNVPLGALTYLVGPNGAGKSNFLDALRFVADSLKYSLVSAIRGRGGMREIRRQPWLKSQLVEIRLGLRLETGVKGIYRFCIGFHDDASYDLVAEECRISSSHGNAKHFYEVRNHVVTSSVSAPPAAAEDRLYLVNASGLPEFRPVYDALSSMAFYNLMPYRMRAPAPLESPGVLERDGSNLASVFGSLSAESKERVIEYLSHIVPGLVGVERYEVGPTETLRFTQNGSGSKQTRTFTSWNMSDGTLRALAALTGLFQSLSSNPTVRLTGIEEPEAALHPSAAAVLRDALNEASLSTQVIVTSHSPDVLDDKDIDTDSLIGVSLVGGETRIGPIAENARSAVKNKLYTAGELLRFGQLVDLEPHSDNPFAQKARNRG